MYVRNICTSGYLSHMLSSFFSCHLRRDNGGVGCLCGTDGYSGTDVPRTYTHACMRIYFDKELFLCAHLHSGSYRVVTE